MDAFDLASPTLTLPSSPTSSGDAFDSAQQDEESFASRTFRDYWQPIGGWLSRTPANLVAQLLSFAAIGDTLDPDSEEMDRLAAEAERQGVQFDRQKFAEASRDAVEFLPTLENIEKAAEEKLGIPFQPKTLPQKLTRLAFGGAKLTPGNLPQKLVGGATVGAAGYAASEAGLPPELGELAIPNPSISQRGQPFPGARKSPAAPFPPTEFENAEQALKILQKQEAAATPPPPPTPPPTSPFQTIKTSQSPKLPSLAGRVTPQEENLLGIRPHTPKTNPTLQDEILDKIYPREIYNAEKTGQSITKQIRANDQSQYSYINSLYDSAEKEFSNLLIEPEALVDDLNALINEAKDIPHPGTYEKKLIAEAEGIIEGISEFGTIGKGKNKQKIFLGYKPTSAQSILNQARSTQRNIDFDFAHGDPANILRPLVENLKKHARNSAISAGNTQALTALDNANAVYADWADIYTNKWVKPLRNEAKDDWISNFKTYKDNPDAFRAINQSLDRSRLGREAKGGVQRDVANEQLQKYFNNPELTKSREFPRLMRELESYLNPEQIASTQQLLSTQPKPQKIPSKVTVQKAGVTKPTQYSSAEKFAAQYLDKKPESVQSLMNSRSGIRQLRKDLSKSKDGAQAFENLAKDKIKNIKTQNRVETGITGRDLYKVYNETHNREILTEILGREAYEEMLNTARIVDKSEWRRSAVTQHIKKASIIKTLGLYGLLL